MKIKRILIGVLSVSCILTSINMTSFAAENTTISTTIGIRVPSTYTVNIPKTITLNNDFSFSEEISVTGDIASDQGVEVKDSAGYFGLTNGSTSIGIDTLQDKTMFDYNDIIAGTKGNWTGTLMNNIEKKYIAAGHYSGNANLSIRFYTHYISTEDKTYAAYNGFAINDDISAITYPDHIVFSGTGEIPGTLLDKDSTGYDSVMARRIADYGFPGNYNDIVVEDGITSVGTYAFKGASIRNVTLPASCTQIKDTSFRGSGLTSIDLSHVTSLGYDAFSFCTSLQNVTLSDQLTYIPSMCFYECSNKNLTIYVPASVTAIESDSFKDVQNIIIAKDSTLEIPEGKWGAVNVTKEQ